MTAADQVAQLEQQPIGKIDSRDVQVEKTSLHDQLEDSSANDEVKRLQLTSAEEKKLLWRIDLAIVPYASLLYLLSFLDRVSIGQARLAGLEKSLKLKGNQFAIALTIFFVSYIAFEVPSNLFLKRLKPQRWICFTMICWSICQTTMGLTHNAQGLYATRWFLGMFESGLFPGLNFLMTCWYTRDEQNRRVSIFFAGSTLAGAFGGLLAFGIRHMDGVGGKGGWAWIFIIEGLLTFVCAIPAWWMVPDFPHDSKLLNPHERAQWLHRLNVSQGVTNASLPFTRRQVTRALCDWRTYVYGLIYFGLGQPFYSLSLFVPTIVAALGFTNANANLLSAAPFGLGTIVTLLFALITDKYAMHSVRGPIIMFLASVTMIGYIVLLCPVSVGAKYGAVFIAVTGVNAAIPAAITWAATNCGPIYTRATVMGVFFTMGNSAGIIASNVYPSSESPKYVRGHSIAIAFTALTIILSAFMTLYLRRENARRDRIYGVPAADGSDCSPLRVGDPELQQRLGLLGMSDTEIIELGDKHPAFRYIA